ncbi:MAG: glutamine synthetase III [Clostridium sp.]|nr:glutamine synthetase III [Prevotella sp.]MCM1429219.1 glutamine synthetase III [Clostridium sp.]MCM1475808.1 glutamine synthetase III [Muribaculaceae bacterium]
MSNLRFKSVEEASSRKAIKVDLPDERPSGYYGIQVFNRQKMFEYLPSETFLALIDAIDNRKPLNRKTADSVAQGMKQWAIERGARHYTHWFQPMTGGTAEKHDAFIEHDGKGGVVENFTGKLLVQQEPDASSFPNGGIRNTFEARGYSAWDISSPAFILDNTLCIPTIFISYTGESLDYKTPLLKSLNSIDKAATRVARLFDPGVKHVLSYLGWEQEYFLVDEALYAARPDLVLTGRTLMGHESAKNQQLEDHYFGAIPSRVEAFMLDLETECHKLGIPAKTRHNEVAPNQFELAPVFEEMNLANDHNLLLMSLMGEVARRHNFRVLLHEKPFAGINGSGKHNNWSLGTDKGEILFSPGKTPRENLRFIAFIANVMAAVHKHNALLKASIMNATNAHRLGGNEAPPAIISMFLGTQLSGILERIVNHATDHIEIGGKDRLNLDVVQIPELKIDTTDRNRTSPFAFTGNRFEYRAVGSSANCASALIALNAAVADQLSSFADSVEARIAKGEGMEQAVLKESRKLIKESQAVHFDGNGYSAEWVEEAKKRGLNTETSAPLMYDEYTSKESIEMFVRTGVFTPKEIEARNEVKWEMYSKKIQIESRVLGDLAINHIIPAAIRYQSRLLENIFKMKQVFAGEKGKKMSAGEIESLEKITENIAAIKKGVYEMVSERHKANRQPDERSKAISYHDEVCPRMEDIRKHIDSLELMVDNEIWPLPKYRELLFIR